MQAMVNMADVEQRLGITFRRSRLLKQALTVGAPPITSHGKPLPSHRQLEYLGDKVLSLLLAVVSLRVDSHSPPAKLAQQQISSNRHLGRVAQYLGLGQFVMHADEAAQEKRGTGHQPKNGNQLANVMEAILGAVFLDRGLAAAERLVMVIMATEVIDTVAVAEKPRELVAGTIQKRPRRQRGRAQWVRVNSPRAIFRELVRTQDETFKPRFFIVQEGDLQGARNFIYEIWLRSYGDTRCGRCLGRGSGQTREAAMDEAARDALRNEFSVTI